MTVLLIRRLSKLIFVRVCVSVSFRFVSFLLFLSNFNHLPFWLCGISLPSYFIYYLPRIFIANLTWLNDVDSIWSSCVIFNVCRHINISNANKFQTSKTAFMYVTYIKFQVLLGFMSCLILLTHTLNDKWTYFSFFLSRIYTSYNSLKRWKWVDRLSESFMIK